MRFFQKGLKHSPLSCCIVDYLCILSVTGLLPEGYSKKTRCSLNMLWNWKL